LKSIANTNANTFVTILSTTRILTSLPHVLNLFWLKRCRLRKHGHTEQADVLAVCINHLISMESSNHLTRLAGASPKELWAAVRKSTGTITPSIVSTQLADPDG